MTTKTKTRNSRRVATVRSAKSARSSAVAKTTLQTRMTVKQKSVVQKAADNRQIAVSEYVRLTVFEQAKRELAAAEQRVYSLTADEQAALWQSLHAPVKLTPAQIRLSRLMRGEE